MQPRLGLALALLAACGAPDVQPLNEAKRLEPTKAVPKDSKTSPAPEPAPAPAPKLAPAAYTRAGDRAAQRDELTFWGFSADGRRYAFETFYYGPGAAECEGLATFIVVDADTDTFADSTPYELKHKQPDAERCDPPDLRAEMSRHREELLHRHGIVLGNQGTPYIPVRESASPPGKAPTWNIGLPGVTLRAELEVLHGGRSNAGDPGAAYTLTVSTGGAAPAIVVEPGKRRRPFVWDYTLEGGVVFASPDGQHLAFIIPTQQLSFEGDRHSYMSNGIKTPASG